MARNAQAGKYGAFPTFHDGNAANRMLVLYIPTAIFATFAHLISARECRNEASHVTLSAVEVQQVVRPTAGSIGTQVFPHREEAGAKAAVTQNLEACRAEELQKRS